MFFKIWKMDFLEDDLFVKIYWRKEDLRGKRGIRCSKVKSRS
jgi:hypothetical protein